VVRLKRTLTPAALSVLTRKMEPRASVRVVFAKDPGGRLGWWGVWIDSTRDSRRTLFDDWSAEIAGRIYRDRRVAAAPDLSGIAVATRARDLSGLAAGESVAAWPRPSNVYVQALPPVLKKRVEQGAATVGLGMSHWRTPSLGGIQAPIVVFRVKDAPKFWKEFDSGCLARWIFGMPRTEVGSSGPASYFGFFMTVTSRSGTWVETAAFAPNETITEISRSAARVEGRRERGKFDRVCRSKP
jgi:hypothetical protein